MISVRQTFASFSLHVKQLIIASELQENEIKLKKTAKCIRALSNHIIEAVQRVACLKEEDVGIEVAKGCDRVHVAADSLVVAADRVHVAADSLVVACAMVEISGSGFKRSGSLTGQATVLHEATVKLLELAIDAEAASVVRQCQTIYAALNSLLSARDLTHLENLLTSYGEVVSQFEQRVATGSVLICEAVNFEAVKSSIDALMKSVPLLSASMKTIFKYPEIEDAQMSKNNVVGLVLSSLDSLSSVLDKKNHSWPLTDSSLKVKQFTTVCSRLAEKLNMIVATCSTSNRDVAGLDVLLNDIVQFAMDLASVAGREFKTDIFKTCSLLIENQTKISEHCQSLSHSVLPDEKSSISVSAQWNHLLIDTLSQLQAQVIDILPHVIISIIVTDNRKPVFNLLKAVKERSRSNDFRSKAEELVESPGDQIQLCADHFALHLKNFCTIMRLATAGSDSATGDVKEMHGYICTAETLGNTILTETEKLSNSDLGRFASYVEGLERDYNEWCINADKLLENVEKLVRGELLMILCGEMIWRNVSCHSHLSVSKDRALDESVVLMTHRFLSLSAKVNDKHLDGWLKNGLRRKIAALGHGINRWRIKVKLQSGPYPEGQSNETERQPTVDKQFEKALSEVESSGGLEGRCGTGPESRCYYRLLQQAVADICWCVKTGRLTNDPHEESFSIVRAAFDRLIDNALTECSATELKGSEAKFDLLTSLGLHGSAMCEIKEIIDCLIFGAVSCAAEEETQSRRLLFMSSHILHSALLVMGAVEQKDGKRIFILEKLAQLTDLVPMFLDEANEVRSFQKDDLQPLYELGEKLCHTMSLLVDFADDILLHWNPVPQNLVTSALDGNWLRLKKETEELNCQIMALMDLTLLAKEETLDIDDEDFKALTKTDSLKEFIEEIESLSYRVMSSARKMNSSEKCEGDFVRELRVLLRDWSTRVLFLKARLDRFCFYYSDHDNAWKERLLWMRQENDRLQNELRCNSERERGAIQMLKDLNFICDQMDDLSKISDELFVPQKLRILSSIWSSKVRKLENRISEKMFSDGTGQQSSSADKSLTNSTCNEKMEKIMPSDGKKGARDINALPSMSDDGDTLRQITQKDCFEKKSSRRSGTDTSTASGKTSPVVQSAIIGSSKPDKYQVSPLVRIRRSLVYKMDDNSYATSGSIFDSINETSRATYQLMEHFQDAREGYDKDHVKELLVTIRSKEKKTVQVANVLIKYCLDEKIGDDVRFALQNVQSILSQLYILVGVKMAINDRHAEDKNLKSSIQRLLESLNNLKDSFEAVCVKGLKEVSSSDLEISAMARQWKIKWIQSQSINSLYAEKDELGLRTSKTYPRPQPI